MLVDSVEASWRRYEFGPQSVFAEVISVPFLEHQVEHSGAMRPQYLDVSTVGFWRHGKGAEEDEARGA